MSAPNKPHHMTTSSNRKKKSQTVFDVLMMGRDGLGIVPSAQIRRGSGVNKRKNRGSNKSQQALPTSALVAGHLTKLNYAWLQKNQIMLTAAQQKATNKHDLHRCAKCLMGPMTKSGLKSHRKSGCARTLLKAAKKSKGGTDLGDFDRLSAIRTNGSSSSSSSSSSGGGKGRGAVAAGGGGDESEEDVEMLDESAEYADNPIEAPPQPGPRKSTYEEHHKQVALKIAAKLNSAYRKRVSGKKDVPEWFRTSMGRRAPIPHWTSSLSNLSSYRPPTFVHVHVPELAYTQNWVHPSLQLNPGAAGDDQYYQHCPCCAGRMVAKEQWVTARVLDFDGTGIVVAKKYECNVCKTTYNGWDARLLKALPAHIQDDFDIIVNRNFAVRRSVAKHVRAAVIGRCTFNQISRVFNQTRCRKIQIRRVDSRWTS